MSADRRPESTYPEGSENLSQGGQSCFGMRIPPPKEETFPSSTPPNQSPHNPLDEDLEALLDRLVDGELAQSKQQEVLRQLECHPEGWRQLALAFLEAQTWRREMPRLVATPLPQNPQTVVRPPSHGRIRSPAWQILVLAGGILVSFLGGYWIRDLWPVFPPHFQEGVVQGTLLPHTVPETKTYTNTKTYREGRLEEASKSRGIDSSFGWEYVTLTTGKGPDGVPEVVRVPVIPASPEHRLASPSPAIPEELLQLLRHWGAEVSHSRHLVPIRIEDGRQIVIPVEHVELYHRPQAERYQ